MFSFFNNGMVDRAIVRIGGRDTHGEDCPEIAYKDVVRYIKENGCSVKATSDDGWIQFEHVVSGQRYSVQLDRMFTGGGGAFLSSKKL